MSNFSSAVFIVRFQVPHMTILGPEQFVNVTSKGLTARMEAFKQAI